MRLYFNGVVQSQGFQGFERVEALEHLEPSLTAGSGGTPLEVVLAT